MINVYQEETIIMKLGIIGTGKIVHEALFAMKPVKTIEVKAIFARPHSKEKGEKLAADHEIDRVYTDYDLLLKEADVDAVYIGLVNSVHHAYAKKALNAGKHVILEKPFTSTVEEADDLIRTARDNGVYILEAITILHGDNYKKVLEWLPKLGKIKLLQGNYSQYSSRYTDYLKGKVAPAFDPELSGGALYDINLYNVYFAVATLGAPEATAYFPNLGFNGIDTSGVEILVYPEFTATLTGAKDADSPSHTIIQGEKGWLKVLGKPNVPEGVDIEYQDEANPDGVPSPSGGIQRAMIRDHFDTPKLHHRMTPEFEDFAKIIDTMDAEAAEVCMNNSLAVMKVLEQSRKAAGIRFGVDDRS